MTVTGLLGFGLHVPSLAEATDYYGAFGMETCERESAVAMRCAGRDQDQITLIEGPQKRLGYVSFSHQEDALADVRRKLAERGIDECDPPPAAPGDGFWFRDPDGVLVNLRADQLAPARQEPPTTSNVAGRYERIDRPHWRAVWKQREDRGVRPRRMGHTILFSPDIVAAEQFYRDVLGFGFSDRTPGLVTLLNTGPGDHHVFGFVQSTHTGLHHGSFEVANIDEISLGAMQMADRGFSTAWGLGRHTIGSNLFYYIRDPWGSWTEYYSDMDQITNDWIGGDWDVPPGVWCPAPPAEFLTNLEPDLAKL